MNSLVFFAAYLPHLYISPLYNQSLETSANFANESLNLKLKRFRVFRDNLLFYNSSSSRKGREGGGEAKNRRENREGC